MIIRILIVFAVSLLLFSCQNDDEMDCPEFVDNGTVSVTEALDNFPVGYFERQEPLIFTNSDSDSLVFEPNLKFNFNQDQVIKTACSNGDSTTHIYESQSLSKSYEASSGQMISISALTSPATSFFIDSNGNVVNEVLNCFLESANISVSEQFLGTNQTSISFRSNPNNCAGFVQGGTNFLEIPDLNLNGVDYQNVYRSNNIFSGQSDYHLYYTVEHGVIGFEDEADVIWGLVN